jgi:hypothetical protein
MSVTAQSQRSCLAMNSSRVLSRRRFFVSILKRFRHLLAGSTPQRPQISPAPVLFADFLPSESDLKVRSCAFLPEQEKVMRKLIIIAGAFALLLGVVTAQAQTACNDGTYSSSSGSGTCSHHGGEYGNSHVHHGRGY